MMARVISVSRMRAKLEGDRAANVGTKVRLVNERGMYVDTKTGWTITGGEVKDLPPQPLSPRLRAAIAGGALAFIEEAPPEDGGGGAGFMFKEEPENFSKTQTAESPITYAEDLQRVTPPAKAKKPAAKKTTPKKPAAKRAADKKKKEAEEKG